jgi:hypothetical protein
MRRPSPVATVLLLTVVALSMPFTLALTSSAFAQEPEPPTGEPQEPEPTPPEPTPDVPAPEEPAGEAPAGEVGGGGTLPRTGWDDALLYFLVGFVLILAGARLRVVTRIRQVVERVRRRNTEVALREALEPIRAARLSPPTPDPDPGPLHVEPSTPTARRLTGVAARDDAER